MLIARVAALGVVLALFAVYVCGCGGSGSHDNTASTSSLASGSETAEHPDITSPANATPSRSTAPVPKPTRRELEKRDRDEDDYVNLPDDDNPSPVGYVLADSSDRKAITALVKRYYAVALKEDGASGCAMFPPIFAKAIPLDYGKLGPSYLRRAAGTCPAVMSLLFKHEHRTLAREVPQMKVVRVSLGGDRGAAFIRFGPLHERFIVVQRENNTWTIAGVLDGELN